MANLTVNYKKAVSTAKIFQYAHQTDACADMYCIDDVFLYPHETKLIHTGIILEIPEGFEGVIRGRSGLARQGLCIHIGTIDSGYRGEIGIVATNLSSDEFKIEKCSRVAQLTIRPVWHINFVETDILSCTERGEKGYGSSGIK